MARRSGITIRDVARRAGVSITTVSHVLNEKGAISEETRDRVRRVVEEMGYRADALARGLRSSRMGVIGLVLRPLDALGSYAPSGVDYFLRFAGAAAARALDLGFGLMQVGDLTKRPITPLAFSLDGYIVMDPMGEDAVVDLLQERGMPFVTLGRDVTRPGVSNWVASDDREAVLTSLTHLRGCGAREVAFVAGVDGNSWNSDGEDVYRAWCAENGTAPRLLRMPESDGEAGGREAARRLLAEGLPDGIHCMTGRHAAGLQAELREHGITTPEHVLLVAGSDAAPSRAGTPPISGFDLNPELLAEATVDLLDATLRGEAPREGMLLSSRFIVRESTTRPAPAA